MNSPGPTNHVKLYLSSLALDATNFSNLCVLNIHVHFKNRSETVATLPNKQIQDRGIFLKQIATELNGLYTFSKSNLNP